MPVRLNVLAIWGRQRRDRCILSDEPGQTRGGLQKGLVSERGMNKKTRMAARMAVSGEEWESEYPRGLKWTKQRKSVYKVLKEAAEPLSAAGIYHLAEREAGGEEYALSTVYRILTAFEEKGLVEKNVSLEDGAVVYTLTGDSHTHYAVCLECRRRIPLQSCPFAHIQLEKETEGFIVTGHRLELYGYCRECGGKTDGGEG